METRLSLTWKIWVIGQRYWSLKGMSCQKRWKGGKFGLCLNWTTILNGLFCRLSLKRRKPNWNIRIAWKSKKRALTGNKKTLKNICPWSTFARKMLREPRTRLRTSEAKRSKAPTSRTALIISNGRRKNCIRKPRSWLKFKWPTRRSSSHRKSWKNRSSRWQACITGWSKWPRRRSVSLATRTRFWCLIRSRSSGRSRRSQSRTTNFCIILQRSLCRTGTLWLRAVVLLSPCTNFWTKRMI